MDSEPIHLVCFRKVLLTVGVEFTHEEYYSKYLGFDDHDCLAAAMRDHDKPYSEEQLTEMIAQKTALVQKAFRESIQPLPGAVELIASASDAGVPLAVCSGGLRDEIELASKKIGVRDYFLTIVDARDVRHGKPDPEGYRLALAQLREIAGRQLAAERCVVCEDSPAGIEAAKDAGMKVLAVTSSYQAGALTDADKTVDSLTEVTVESLEELL